MQILDKTLILTEYANLLPIFLDTLRAIKIERYEGDSPLASLDALKNKIKEEGNSSFIRREILSFIRNYGSPYIIIDMLINSNLDNNEMTKVFKTFLLSYIIIMESEQFKDVSCNMLILIDKKNYERINSIYAKPQNILNILKTNDERINKIINNYMTDQTKFMSHFNLLLINAERDPSIIKSEVTLFSNRIIKSMEHKQAEGQTHGSAPTETITPMGPKTTAAQAADVIIRLGNLLYKNNEAPIEYDNNLNLTEKEIYILGNFTGYTRLDVIKRLFELMKREFENDFDFKKENTVIINIPKDSEIDSTIPTTIAQLMSKELRTYKIKIKLPLTTYNAMQKATGFNMIQKNVIITN
ncbi:MAG: hypothetical protein FWH53_01280 [Leptospirales bacterium]|nr:hypothetical protein [Leptospirales bacterium]